MKMESGKEAWLRLTEKDLNYHSRQYEEPYRSTVFAIRHLKEHAGFSADSSYRVLDVGCGGGANLHWLAREFPKCDFVGIDVSADLIRLAGEKNRDVKNVKFLDMDFREARTLGKFDFVLSFQVLSWLSVKEAFDLMEAKFSLAERGVFLTSLFCRQNLDYEIRVKDHYQGKEHFYNIYALDGMRERAARRGFGLSGLQEFDIDVDLPGEGVEGIGTYTVRSAEGRRLQFSGCLHLPWHFLLFMKEGAGQAAF
jgi:SAM-dependent methyltransferase